MFRGRLESFKVAVATEGERCVHRGRCREGAKWFFFGGSFSKTNDEAWCVASPSTKCCERSHVPSRSKLVKRGGEITITRHDQMGETIRAGSSSSGE